MPNETAPNDLGDVAIGSSDNPYTEKIEDPAKARVMAESEDSLQTAALEDIKMANNSRAFIESNRASGTLEAADYQREREAAESHEEMAKVMRAHANEAGEEAGAQYDADHVDDGRIKDVDMAETMAHAEDPLVSIATRLEKSGNPEDVELAKTLREEGDELAEKAKRDFEREQEEFEEEKRRLIGWVLATVKGEINFTDLIATTPELSGDMYYDQPIDGISTAHKEQLCKVVYDLLGAKEPTKKDVDRAYDKRGVYGGPSAIITLETESPDTGLKIIEKRLVKPQGLMRKITENGRMLSIQRTDR